MTAARRSLTNHIGNGFWLLANEGVWRGWPSETLDIVEHEFDRSAQDGRNDLTRLDPNLRGDLAGTGLTPNPVDTMGFQAALQKAGFHVEWSAGALGAFWRDTPAGCPGDLHSPPAIVLQGSMNGSTNPRRAHRAAAG